MKVVRHLFFILLIASCQIIAAVNGHLRFKPNINSLPIRDHVNPKQQNASPSNQSSIPDEKWDYIEVRPGAHMFWWFHGYTGKNKSRREIPLVL